MYYERLTQEPENGDETGKAMESKHLDRDQKNKVRN